MMSQALALFRVCRLTGAPLRTVATPPIRLLPHPDGSVTSCPEKCHPQAALPHPHPGAQILAAAVGRTLDWKSCLQMLVAGGGGPCVVLKDKELLTGQRNGGEGHARLRGHCVLL